ncbi:MAG: FAD-binding domain-containing protein [Pseudomonadota bacterium]
MSETAKLPGLTQVEERVTFTPTREAGLARLDRFVARAGRHYAGQRNYDLGPDRRSNVSALSPWIRHRLITEHEVLRATLARHAPSTAEKFIQEVFWRTYFKGWLEQRPSVWVSYQQGLLRSLEALEHDPTLAQDYDAAIGGSTGIDGFDPWARELVETGYLHNHARMWFASIWIFTLRLPWELGADFFLRHLLDGDPASNTLSWRWVAGLHTKGKTYRARVSNISKYTEGRFRPEYKLSNIAEPLVETTQHPKVPIRRADQIPDGEFLLLVTEEEGQFADVLKGSPAGTLGLLATDGRSPLAIGQRARAFAQGAVQDGVSRNGGGDVLSVDDWAEPIIAKTEQLGVTSVVTAYAPVGPVADRLADALGALEQAGLALHQIRRTYDDLAWPHATKGFFELKRNVPQVLRGLGLGS